MARLCWFTAIAEILPMYLHEMLFNELILNLNQVCVCSNVSARSRFV